MAPSEIDGIFAVGDYEIYLSCGGGPGPTVVFEAAVGEDHTNWSAIAELIRDRAYACVYDRIGVGRSSKPKPAMAANDHVAQLHELMEVAGVPRPVVLVGHSYGGFVAFMAAVAHPEDVAALILVDASHPSQDGRIEAVMTDAHIATFHGHLAEVGTVVDWNASSRQAAAAYGPLPDIPLAVISATRFDRSDDDPPDYPHDAIQRIWLELQDEHARLRPDARHVMAPTGHYVHVEDPDLVVDEIIRILQKL